MSSASKKVATANAVAASAKKKNTKKYPHKKKRKEKLRLITVKEGRSWFNFLVFLLLILFSLISASILYILNPTFKENIDGFNFLISQVYKKTTASALDISKLIISPTTPSPEPVRLAIINCPGCPKVDIQNYPGGSENRKAEYLDYFLSSDEELPVERNKLISLPAIVDGNKIFYPPPRFVLTSPSKENRFFKGGVEKIDEEIFAYLSFGDDASKKIAPILDELIHEKPGIRLYFKYLFKNSVDEELAATAHCSGRQGIFWPTHNLLFENQVTGRDDIIQIVSSIKNIDVSKFEKCLDDETIKGEISKDQAEMKMFSFAEGPVIIVDNQVYYGEKSREELYALFSEEKDKLNYDPALSWGKADAKIIFIEYSDFECPFCKKQALDVVTALRKNHSEEILYVHRDFPISRIHPNAINAAIAARCAGKENKYWEMYEKLFEFQDFWRGADNPGKIYADLAIDLGLNIDIFLACQTDNATKAEVFADFNEGINAGIRATPTIIIDNDGKKTTIEGILSYKDFERLIDGN